PPPLPAFPTRRSSDRNLTEGPAYPRAAWANSLAAAERTQIEAMWYGYYASLSSANDALSAIRTVQLDVPGSRSVRRWPTRETHRDRKSTRLNSSHVEI